MLSPSAPFRAEATVTGPVGFAETISTWIASGRIGETPAVAGVDLGERLGEERVVHPKVQESGPGDLRARIPGSSTTFSASSAAISRGERPRLRAACSATFVA